MSGEVLTLSERQWNWLLEGLAGHHKTEAILAGCWAHARRKFIEAKAVQPKDKTGRADQALNLIQKLHDIEKPITDAVPEKKRRARQELAAPIIQQLKAWLDKTVTGSAISYTLNQSDKLQVYLEHGVTAIDNNLAQRAIKSFVIGRKNFLFSNTRSGAQASTIYFTV